MILFFSIVLMTLISIPANEIEAASSLKVSLPAFKVSLNGVIIENSYREYPLIVYNNITYFPMTYYDSRFMGLESLWNEDTGLTIVKTDLNWDYHKYKSSFKNSNIYNAQIAPFKVTVNGKAIDKSGEKYPLLLFRNITYFPLTWEYAVEEFGWKYTFDQNKGLVINSYYSAPLAGQTTLPIVTRENGEKGAFTLAGDFFYYEGANGIIYQAPIENSIHAKSVYQLPEAGFYGSNTYVDAFLKTKNKMALLSYHTGGPTMGSYHNIWLKEDGTFEEIDSGNSVMEIFDEYQIRINQGVPPFKNNLQIKKYGENDYNSIGNPDYIYGWIWRLDGITKSSHNVIRSNDLYLIDDNVYVLGYYDKVNFGSIPGIYRININNNETIRLCGNEATSFKIVDDKIYFTDQNQYIYQVPLSGGKAELLVKEAVGLYDVLGGKLYYSLKDKNYQLYIYGSDESVNPEGILKNLENQNGYMVAVFDKSSKSQYKMMIFNDSGKMIFKTIENILLVRIENGKIVFVKDN